MIHNIKAMVKGKANQENFISLLDAVPSTTALVLIEDELLENKHFLIKWIKKNPERSWMQVFALPKGPAMTHWILEQAKDMGGSFENQAAQLLASYIDEDPRLAKSEIDKLSKEALDSSPFASSQKDRLIWSWSLGATKNPSPS